MGVASGCGEHEAGVAGWNLWVWLLGVVVRRYIDFLILLIPTPLVSVLFYSSIPTFCSFCNFIHTSSRQGNTTNLNIFLSMENEKRAAQVDSNQRHTAHETDALPTELPRQLSWLGRIKAIQDKANHSNLT